MLSSLTALRYLTINLDFAQSICGVVRVVQGPNERTLYRPFRSHMEAIMNDKGWAVIFENAARLEAKTITWETTVDPRC